MAVEVDAATKEEDDGPRGRGSKDNIARRAKGKENTCDELTAGKKNDTQRGGRREERKDEEERGQP